MPDPTFTPEDLADSAALNLPAELIGKTPAEIAQYYQRREELIVRASRQQAPPEPTPAAPPEIKFDMFNRPEESVRRIAQREVNTAMRNAAAAVNPALIASCKIIMKDRFADWEDFRSVVEAQVATFTAEAQMNPDMWESAYYFHKGKASDKLRDRAVAAARNPTERSVAPSAPPEKPRDLSPEELVYANNFKMSPEKYREAADRYERTGGLLPVTLDSRNPRQRRKAS